jgi:hypothetical protein
MCKYKNILVHLQYFSWSFGVLLYELLTLGQEPYEQIENDAIIEYLNSGKRLEKPDLASDAMYELSKQTFMTENV